MAPGNVCVSHARSLRTGSSVSGLARSRRLPHWGLAVVTACMIAFSISIRLPGQSPSQNTTGPSRATQIPLAENPSPSGSVSITQQTAGSSGASAISTTTTITVQGPFAGSTPAGPVTPGVLPLSLSEALSRAMRFNLGALTEDAEVKQAVSTVQESRSRILPTANAAISEEFERLNLRTMGVESPQFPTAVTFNFYDARAVRLRQSAVDLVRIENLHSASQNLSAAREQASDARDLIVLAVGGGYLELIATQARVSAARAQVETARAIYQQAEDRRVAGLAPRIDANRARVQLQTEQQRQRSLQAEFDTQKLRLARMIGIPLAQQFTPSDTFPYSPADTLTQESAWQRAQANRRDLQAALLRIRAAQDALKAARAERLPSLEITGDFGAAGRTPSSKSTSVYSVFGTLTVPLYEGGRIHADVEQAGAALQLRRQQYEDLRGQVDQDIRQAFIDLDAAADQVNVAASNADLARETLGEARDRFSAGVTDTVEVVQAEQAAVQADDEYITAVFQHNLAKVSLARAVGNAEQVLPQLLRKTNDRTAP